MNISYCEYLMEVFIIHLCALMCCYCFLEYYAAFHRDGMFYGVTENLWVS
jgi:hypothetical protein